MSYDRHRRRRSCLVAELAWADVEGCLPIWPCGAGDIGAYWLDSSVAIEPTALPDGRVSSSLSPEARDAPMPTSHAARGAGCATNLIPAVPQSHQSPRSRALTISRFVNHRAPAVTG